MYSNATEYPYLLFVLKKIIYWNNMTVNLVQPCNLVLQKKIEIYRDRATLAQKNIMFDSISKVQFLPIYSGNI